MWKEESSVCCCDLVKFISKSMVEWLYIYLSIVEEAGCYRYI